MCPNVVIGAMLCALIPSINTMLLVADFSVFSHGVVNVCTGGMRQTWASLPQVWIRRCPTGIVVSLVGVVKESRFTSIPRGIVFRVKTKM
jgi:hypothetical protein